MTNTTKLTCVIDTTDASCPLGLEIWVDQEKLLDTDHVQQQINFEHDLPDQIGDHEIKFVMKGKTEEHTKISESGEIVKDARLAIANFAFDQIELGHLFSSLAIYEHDFNGTQNITQEKFYGEMGCNGTVSLKFTTPIYLWLLENM
jgi:hypothetical protein